MSVSDPRAAEPFERLLQAPRGLPVALLHSCGDRDFGSGGVRLYRSPVEVLEIDQDAVGPDTWAHVDAFLARHFERPVVGFLGYDLRDATEALPRRIAADGFGGPALHLQAHEHCEEWPGGLAVPPYPDRLVDAFRATDVAPHVARADYEARVAQVVEHIRAGDIFQANLTQPFTGDFEGDPRALFWKLCATSPAPFAAYVETGSGFASVGSSPEEFLALDGLDVRTRPIKGTRPREFDPLADRALLEELLASDKDQAELAMIVDLLRNDVGKVAEIGSVKVGPFPEHASFAQVHHLFATVRATLRPEVTVGELLAATFPGGSITGAPKLRCMEILEDLELVRRGVYTGAVGWFGPGPRLHLNVAIRTMTVHAGRVRLNVGGGITADSDPGLEYEETLHKAAGMLRALAVPDRPRTGEVG